MTPTAPHLLLAGRCFEAEPSPAYSAELWGAPVPEDRRPEEIDRINTASSWHGVLTLWNAEAICERIRRMLAGKQYTFAAYNAGFNPCDSLDVRTSQVLEGSVSRKPAGDPSHIHYKNEGGIVTITVCDSYGVWGLSSCTLSYDRKDYRNEYLVFDHDRSGDQLKIVKKNGCGDILVWRISVEDPKALADKLEDAKS